MGEEIAIREIDRLKQKMGEGITLDETLFEALNCSIKALGKQIPNKPTIKTINEKVIDVFCPTCNIKIFRCFHEEGKEKTWNYSQQSHKCCVECGQKLGWV